MLCSVVLFLCIPYAAPPQRFELPQRPISWDGVRDMDDPGPAAPHRIKPFPAIDPSPLVGHGSDGTDGEYLRLNIWAPREAVAAPVMLFIHGGGFVAGRKDATGHDGSSEEHTDELQLLVRRQHDVVGLNKQIHT